MRNGMLRKDTNRAICPPLYVLLFVIFAQHYRNVLPLVYSWSVGLWSVLCPRSVQHHGLYSCTPSDTMSLGVQECRTVVLQEKRTTYLVYAVRFPLFIDDVVRLVATLLEGTSRGNTLLEHCSKVCTRRLCLFASQDGCSRRPWSDVGILCGGVDIHMPQIGLYHRKASTFFYRVGGVRMSHPVGRDVANDPDAPSGGSHDPMYHRLIQAAVIASVVGA